MRFWREPILWLALLCGGAVAAWAFWPSQLQTTTEGNPARGRELVSSYGCTACHTIPGKRGPHAIVGPVLSHIGSQTFLAGRLQNSPENMVLWISSPKSIDPQTAMPQMGVDERDAIDIMSYLFTLR